MKRAGFTMIELIFVIVILGILAAVALPRFIGVSQQAHNQKVTAFIGTLNRTVGPAMWAESLANGNGGVVGAAGANLCATMVDVQLDALPEELVDNGDCTFTGDLSQGATFGIGFTDGNATNAPVWAENNDTQA